jgi:hypothetical protein
MVKSFSGSDPGDSGPSQRVNSHLKATGEYSAGRSWTGKKSSGTGAAVVKGTIKGAKFILKGGKKKRS